MSISLSYAADGRVTIQARGQQLALSAHDFAILQRAISRAPRRMARPVRPLVNDYQQVIDRACELFNLDQRLLCGPSRAQHVTMIRHIVAWVIRTRWPECPLAEVGKLLGGRDHTTMVNAVTKITALRQIEPRIAGYCQRLLEAL